MNHVESSKAELFHSVTKKHLSLTDVHSHSIYIHAFSRRFHQKWLTLHSRSVHALPVNRTHTPGLICIYSCVFWWKTVQLPTESNHRSVGGQKRECEVNVLFSRNICTENTSAMLCLGNKWSNIYTTITITLLNDVYMQTGSYDWITSLHV